MARQPALQTQSRNLSPQEKVSAVARLEARVKELHDLQTGDLRRGDDPTVSGVESRIRSTLANIYGQTSPEYDRLQVAASLDATHYSLSAETSSYEIRKGVERGRLHAISILQGEIDALKEDISFLTSETTVHIEQTKQAPKTAALSKEVFIVHGRDDAAKTAVARLIERAGLEAVILHEQPNGGRTIIQKFEDHGSAAGFAIVVLTPDDVGGLDKDSLQPRARQNVIGEMFWFAGRLGRERVCALKKGLLELPTDFAGVGYTDMDDSGAWKSEVLRELQHAGYKDLNWQKATA